jgi:hypothetical protein
MNNQTTFTAADESYIVSSRKGIKSANRGVNDGSYFLPPLNES